MYAQWQFDLRPQSSVLQTSPLLEVETTLYQLDEAGLPALLACSSRLAIGDCKQSRLQPLPFGAVTSHDWLFQGQQLEQVEL